MTTEKLNGLLSLNELSLTDSQQEKIIQVFENRTEAEEILSAVDTDNTDIMVHVMPLTNVLREDVRRQPFAREELLKSAPERSEDSWQVPRLVK